MEETVGHLVGNLSRRLKEASRRDDRILVGLCGIPGSGKSQLARHVSAKLNADAQSERSIVVGMDGWHLTREQLDAMPDPQLARDKRGAAWTFDAKSFADFVTKLRESPQDQRLSAPSFSHSLKDPVADDIVVEPHHQIVILEGLYANVCEGDWARAAALYDERWVVECDECIARARLIVRHVATGVSKDELEAEWRANNNDLPNGRYLLEHILEPVIRIRSIDHTLWRGAS